MFFKNQQTVLLKDHFNGDIFPEALFGDDQNLIPFWKTFFQSFNQLGLEEISNRCQDMMRYLKENGVTYNIYGDPLGLNRTWNLDLIPFLIEQNDWQLIQKGLAQRAHLFDLILKDIYGEQKLIKAGILPMEVIYCHPGFLRECCGIQQKGFHYLTIYSADMARSKDGSIWILNDRTQAPSGSGYAMENRMAMARIVPELFNGLKVKRLSPYYNAMREALIAMAPNQNAQPRIVILTPGQSNETYFEHSFLASHLGFTLVQGDDLMVKDNFVWLKTLGGLEKVDVIVRRVDDIYCDPLELKEDSQLGVPGLLQAVRSGHISIANPLGSSVVENPGLIPFLPAIAQYFLHAPLILPTIASWWCGQPKELDYVLKNLSSLVIKRIFRESATRTSVDATLLDHQQLEELQQRIKAQPHLYVAQEKVDFSTTPAWVNGRAEASHALFRSFAVSSANGFIVMEGGLTRTSLDKTNMVISNQMGGFSKDTWVLSGEDGNMLHIKKEQDHFTADNQVYQSNMLPSRTAENLFWVGRYAERVLGNARFQRTILQYVEDANKAFLDNDQSLKTCLLPALTAYTCTYPGFTGEGEKKISDPWHELSDILYNHQRSGSLAYNLNGFIRAVHAVRDYWSTDTWRVLREMEEAWQQAAAAKHRGHYKMISAVDHLITFMMAFISLNRESISRDQGWNLLDAGRKTEQSLLLISMLQATLVKKQEDTVEHILQETVLTASESLVNYRFKYRAHLQMPLVLDLMLFDEHNPRSLLYLTEKLKNYLSRLPRLQPDINMLAEHDRLAYEATGLLYRADKDELSVLDEKFECYRNLEYFLHEMNQFLYGISDAVSKTYFKHAQAQQQLFR